MIKKSFRTKVTRGSCAALLLAALLLSAACQSGGQHTDAAGHTAPASETTVPAGETTAAKTTDTQTSAATSVRFGEDRPTVPPKRTLKKLGSLDKNILLGEQERRDRYLWTIPNYSDETFYFMVKFNDDHLGQPVLTSIMRTEIDRIEPETVCEFPQEEKNTSGSSLVIHGEIFLVLGNFSETARSPTRSCAFMTRESKPCSETSSPIC